ncbi:MAG: hypothetical protein WC552_01400 [Candidatus Omnitrophota bacterium]
MTRIKIDRQGETFARPANPKIFLTGGDVMNLRFLILTCFIFSALYPLCFFIQTPRLISKGRYKFHLFLVNLLAGITVVILLFSPLTGGLKAGIVLWKAALLSLSGYFWKKKILYPAAMLLPVLIGIFIFLKICGQWFPANGQVVIGELLIGLALGPAIFLSSRDQDWPPR